MQDFKKLEVWHASVALAVKVYDESSRFPAAERFGLRSQIRAAAVSISSNIAEGSGRGTGPDMARFVQIAIGSASEVESQLLVAQRLGFIRDVESLGNDVDHIRRRLIRLLQSIEANEPRSS